MGKYLGVCALALLLLAGQASSQDLRLQQSEWIKTGPENSLVRARRLFQFRNQFVRTASEETNIHAHYRNPNLSRIRNYTFTGQMKVADSGGGIGVTFHSRYRRADRYYRLRYFPGGNGFEIAPHPDGVQVITDGVEITSIVPTPGTWYNFKIIVRTSTGRTRIKAKVWRSGTVEPPFQIDASDSSPIRIKYGRLGIWSMGTGEKRWRNLRVAVVN